MAEFGDSAVAGAAIVGRISPVAFSFVFALSGSVGPIIGQNAGAGLYHRVRKTLLDALLCNLVYVLLIWGLLWLLLDQIVLAFSARDEAEQLIRFYVNFLVVAFGFNGMLFVANASFNNLHRAYMATVFNFCRALLGTIPCVYLGAKWYGAPGVMAGEAAGAVIFGTLAFAAVLVQVRSLDRRHATSAQGDEPEAVQPWQFSSGHTQMGQGVVQREEP
jgi:Na+-driven multidrug efflux pump